MTGNGLSDRRTADLAFTLGFLLDNKWIIPYPVSFGYTNSRGKVRIRKSERSSDIYERKETDGNDDGMRVGGRYAGWLRF